MTAPTKLQHATFTPMPEKGPPKKGKDNSFDVQFNPVSLQFTVSNTLSSQGQDKKQYVDKTTAKLTMDLIFDTTDSSEDVRLSTQQIVQYMHPMGQGKKKTPAIVRFDWGLFSFQGMVESYKETIEFFSADGVPLRSSVNLTLANQDFVFEKDATAAPPPQAVEVPNAQGSGAGTNGGGNHDLTSLATDAGDPNAGRALAAANDEDSMRFPSGPSLTIDASISLQGPVAFAAGGIGGGVGIGAGFAAGAGIGIGGGISAGAGFGVGGGIGASGGIGGGFAAGGAAGIGLAAGGAVGLGGGFAAGGGVVAGGGFAAAGGFVAGGAAGGIAVGGFAGGSVGFTAGGFVAGDGVVAGGVVAGGDGAFLATGGFSGTVGGMASAGVSASSGAFSWLHTSSTTWSTSTSLDPDLLIETDTSIGVATGEGAIFQIGGQAVVQESASLQSRIQFDEW